MASPPHDAVQLASSSTTNGFVLPVLLLAAGSPLSSSLSDQEAVAGIPPASQWHNCSTRFEVALSARQQRFSPLRYVCPANCSSSVGPADVVIGSFPYHANSSLCLAGIHSGLVDEALGGSVWFAPFFSQTWDNASVDIYPHGSERGTYSNGVQSLDVPPSELQQLTLDSYAYSLRSRGTVFNQRRWAPWSPRAGQLHVSGFEDVTCRAATALYVFQLLCGGRNATHYMNDCWLYRFNGLGGRERRAVRHQRPLAAPGRRALVTARLHACLRCTATQAYRSRR